METQLIIEKLPNGKSQVWKEVNGEKKVLVNDADLSGVLHIRVGSDTWSPTQEDLESVLNMFEEAMSDPQGGVVVTNHQVEAKLIRFSLDTIGKKESKEEPEKFVKIEKELFEGALKTQGMSLISPDDVILGVFDKNFNELATPCLLPTYTVLDIDNQNYEIIGYTKISGIYKHKVGKCWVNPRK